MTHRGRWATRRGVVRGQVPRGIDAPTQSARIRHHRAGVAALSAACPCAGPPTIDVDRALLAKAAAPTISPSMPLPVPP